MCVCTMCAYVLIDSKHVCVLMDLFTRHAKLRKNRGWLKCLKVGKRVWGLGGGGGEDCYGMVGDLSHCFAI